MPGEVNQDDDVLLANARAVLGLTGLPGDSWAVGEFKDDRPCLTVQNGRWVAGYFERGRFEIEFAETDFSAALARFTAWVESIIESTEASSASTAKWLRRMGKERP